MVLFDQNNFRLNKTGLHMVDTWSVHPNLTFVTSRVCLDVTMRALSREHGELLSVGLALHKKMRANKLAMCKHAWRLKITAEGLSLPIS